MGGGGRKIPASFSRTSPLQRDPPLCSLPSDVMASLGSYRLHCSNGVFFPGYLGPEQLPDCLKGCDVVVIPAGVPRKPGV